MDPTSFIISAPSFLFLSHLCFTGIGFFVVVVNYPICSVYVVLRRQYYLYPSLRRSSFSCALIACWNPSGEPVQNQSQAQASFSCCNGSEWSEPPGQVCLRSQSELAAAAVQSFTSFTHLLLVLAKASPKRRLPLSPLPEKWRKRISALTIMAPGSDR